MKNDKMVRFLKNILVLIAVLPLLGSCIREDEVANSPQGNFEALWKIIDEQYCFLEYKQIDWDAIHDEYSRLITGSNNNNKFKFRLSKCLRNHSITTYCSL